MTKVKKTMPELFYMGKIRRIIENEEDGYKALFEIRKLIKKWEEA